MRPVDAELRGPIHLASDGGFDGLAVSLYTLRAVGALVLAALVVVMNDVTDPRGRQGKRHLLTSVLTIAVLGCLCGCDDAEALQDWAEKEEDWLSDYLELRWGVPSQDTFLRVLAMIDPREFRMAFMRWVRGAFRRGLRGGLGAFAGTFLAGILGNF